MKLKIISLGTLIVLTVAIHYGWVLEPIFGDSHWIHAVHSRFCYIPIVIAASLFGIRGGLITATIISVSVIPFMLDSSLSEHNRSSEIVEIIFYYALAILIGAIIERVLIQREKNKDAQLELERTYRLSLMGQMAATMAHEIKNPLASIKGSVEILCDPQINSSDKKEFETIVLKEIKRIDNTIKEYLNYARPKQIELTKMNLSESVQVAMKQIVSQAEESKIVLKNDVTDNIIIKGDQAKIHQVLLNLLLNALQASPYKNIITIKSKSELGKIILSIADTGSGMKQSELLKIFDPFYTTKDSGSGLGLAVVKSIIEGHNGHVTVESQENKGTIFNIILPLYGDHNDD